MAQPCTAILIDPFNKTITEVVWNGDFHHIYQLIDCETYDCARINRQGDAIFVDDEGLFKEEQCFFKHDDYPQPLAGKGLILGCDAEGESIMPSISLAEAQEKISFGFPVPVADGSVLWMAV